MALDLAPLATNRPYCPPSNVQMVLHRLRSRNLPERVDADYLRDAGVPEGSIGRTIFGLRFTGLLEGDIPTSALRSLATSTDEEYQTILAGLIRESYREVFDVLDPAQDSQDRFINFFRRYTPASQRERMVALFLGMCREAGMATLDAPRQRSAGSGSAKGTRAAKVARRDAAPNNKGTDVETRGGAGGARQGREAGGQPLFGVTEDDIGLLEEEDFDEVWAALGKIARARAKASRRERETSSAVTSPAGEHQREDGQSAGG